MKSRYAVVLLATMAFASVAAVATAGDAHLAGSYADALARAAQEGKPVVLDFFTEW